MSDCNNKKKKIGIIDSGTSNIRSVIYANRVLGNDILIIDKPEISLMKNIDNIIFPGIGNFNFVMKNLREKGFDDFILEFINKKKPALFICIGMQILLETSEESKDSIGLGIIKGNVKKIPSDKKNFRPVPINGWNTINITKRNKIFSNLNSNNLDFYFTHSYYCDVKDKNIIDSETNYKGHKYCASLSYKNIYAFQFHPEKSAESGLSLYRNFCKID